MPVTPRFTSMNSVVTKYRCVGEFSRLCPWMLKTCSIYFIPPFTLPPLYNYYFSPKMFHVLITLINWFCSILRPRKIVSSEIMTLWWKSWYLIARAKPKPWRSSRHRSSWSARSGSGCWPRRRTEWGAWRGRSLAPEPSRKVPMTLTMGEFRMCCQCP